MAAAYAAVVSLMNTIDLLQINHPRLFISFDNKQIQSLHTYVVFFQHFLEEGLQQQEALESQIAAAAHAAEDIIESQSADQLLDRLTEKSFIYWLRLRKVIKEMNSVREKVREVMKRNERTAYNMHEQPTNPMPMTSSTLSTTGKSTMVGFDDILIRLMDTLTGQNSNRQIIPITGMGGIGKTTLAKNVYENSVIVQYFDIRGWVAVSQRYNVRETLKELLSCIKKEEESQMVLRSDDELGEELYKFLSGWRYLIVLDDVWSIEVWDKIKFFFPDNNAKSRIIVTTREASVANHFGSLCFVMNFLDKDQSWNLFCQKAFGQQDYCPPEFEDIGTQIIKKCEGLPLSIVVIAGLLQKSNRSQQFWENIANGVNSILRNSQDYKTCLSILSLSYTHLPAHLKPCFLYMGVFREDHEIRVSQLTKLWVAEGFLKPNKPQSLEEVAEGYLKDLVDRNLILVHRLGSSGKIKSCKIHDLLRDLCSRVSKEEKLLCFTRVIGIPLGMDRKRRIVFSKRILEENYDPAVFHALHSGSLARDLVLYEDEILGRSKRDCCKPIFQQVRHIVFKSASRICDSANLSHISLFCNLQTLVITGSGAEFVAPTEIWVIRQLRHLQFHKVFLPDPPPPPSDLDQQEEVFLNLQTLRRVVNFNLCEEVCRRIPNIKKLVILYRVEPEGSISNHCIYNLGRFHKLVSLRLEFLELPFRNDLFQNITFPSSLVKLSLIHCKVYWDDLTIIGSLPHLEVLKLLHCAASGSQWNPIEGEFLRLKFLKIYSCNLRTWNADNSHFPVLETLLLYSMYRLEEIPLSFGDIPTLKHIHLNNCKVPAAISAMKILEEQESFGNEDIQVRVKFQYKSDFEWFKKLVEPETLTSKNFQLAVTL